MADSTVRLAKCCRNCRQYRRKSWIQMQVAVCALTGERVTAVAYCPRFRWAAGLRPPKPKPPPVPMHGPLPAEEVSDGN